MSLRHDSYCSLDSILALSTRLQCKFQIDAAGLAYIEHDAELAAQPRHHALTNRNELTATLKAGTKVELPLWLVGKLASKRMVNVSLPKFLTERFKVALLADPTSVHLGERCPYFYSVGLLLSNIFSRQDIREMLQQSIAVRFQHILTNAQLHGNRHQLMQSNTTDVFKQRLTVNERSIFEDRIRSQMRQRHWKDREHIVLKPSSIIVRAKKQRLSY